MIRRERLVGRELQLHQQRTQEKERAELRVDEIRVFPEPPKPRTPREVALEQRPGIDVRAPAHLAPEHLADPPMQLAQLRVEHIMVVVAARVSRHRPRRLGPTIIHRDDDRASHSLVRQPRVAPLVRPLREIVHLAGVPAFEPSIEMRRCLYAAERGNSDEIESEPVALRANPLLDRAHGRGHCERTAHRAYRSTSSAGATAS